MVTPGPQQAAQSQGACRGTAVCAPSDSTEPEVTTFVGRADGAGTANVPEVSVAVRPSAAAGRSVVLLQVSSPMPETVASAYFAPDEAHRLAAALSTAAFAAAGRSSGVGVFPAGMPLPGCEEPASEECAGRTEITAVEGTSAAELSAAIALLPAGTVLADFSSDADVCLIFGPPAQQRYPESGCVVAAAA